MITFGDSSTAAQIPFEYAALYSPDCDFPCPPDVAKRWDKAHRRWITFHGDPTASIIDWEPGTRDYQQPELLRDWLLGRAAEPTMRHGWIYTDLADAAQAAHWARGLDYQWWVATKDITRRSRSELAAMLQDHGVPAQYATPGRVAAQQLIGVNYDTDYCFVDGDW